jgi:hypothetical protein
MPRFKDEKNPALNEFRRINAEVVRRRKKKYANQESLIPRTPVGQDPRDLALYEGFIARLSALYTAVNEIFTTLTLQNLTGGRDVIIDRFVATSVNAGRLTRDLKDYFFRKMSRSLNRFSPAEVESSATYTNNIQQLELGITGMLNEMEGRARGRAREFVLNIMATLGQNYKDELDELIGFIIDGINSYSQPGISLGATPTLEIGAGFTGAPHIRVNRRRSGGQSQIHFAEKVISTHRPFNALPFSRLNDQVRAPITTMPYPRPIDIRRSVEEIPDARFFRKIGGAELYSHEPVMKGGQGVASRVGLQFGFPQFLNGPYPPRNTQDLKDLPRRFL